MITLKDMPLPETLLANHVAVLGKTGSGKTFATKGLVEQLIRAGERVCVVDPNGAWWGLRAGAGPGQEGLPVTIFGGEHGDIPINDHSGEALGTLVAQRSFACVIDLDGLSQSAKHRFVTGFAEQLFKENSRPLYLILDEADDLAPQNPLPESKRMLGAIDRIVRRGRRKGFRVWFITQRPAVLNKNILTQAESLILMRLVSTQDRHAIKEWIRAQADEGQERTVVASLAKLARGEGWVWSPECDLLERVVFPKITTHDSSSTPNGAEGEAVQLAPLSDNDLADVRSVFDEAEQQARENDPKALKARIAELEAQVASGDSGGARGDDDRVADLHRRLAEEYKSNEALRELIGLAYQTAIRYQRSLDEAGREASELRAMLHQSGQVPATAVAQSAPLAARPAAAAARPIPAPTTNGVHPNARPASGVSRSQQALLDALGWFAAAGINAVQRSHAASVAGVSPRSSGFDKNCSTLRTLGLIDYPGDGMLALTRDGARVAARPAKPGSLSELHQAWLSSPALSGPQRELLGALLRSPTRTFARADLALSVGVSHLSSGFDKNLSRLSSLGLATYPRPGHVTVGPLLYPEGLR